MQFLDLQAQYQAIKPEIDSAIQRVLDSGLFVLGPFVTEFEKNFAKYCGVKHAIGVGNGTDALFLSLKALDIGEGDEVITTPFTFFATAEVIANVGAKPVFVDIRPDTFNIDVEKIEAAITDKTRAIMPVHLYGQMCDMDRILEIALKHGLKVIEDAAQSVGAKYKDARCGGHGDAVCFSFFPSKNLGCYGDGGCIVTNDDSLAEELRMLRAHGSKKKYYNEKLGVNSRLDAIQAAILDVKLEYIDEWNEGRAVVAARYNEALSGVSDIVTPVTLPDCKHVFHQYTIRTQRRDELAKHLGSAGVPTMVYYPTPMHLLPALAYLKHSHGDFPEAEKAAQKSVSLPMYSELSGQDQEEISTAIKTFF